MSFAPIGARGMLSLTPVEFLSNAELERIWPMASAIRHNGHGRCYGPFGVRLHHLWPPHLQVRTRPAHSGYSADGTT